jgi:hypothetical protein
VRSVMTAGLLLLTATPVLAQTPQPPAQAGAATLHLACEGVATFSGPDGHPDQTEGQVLVELTGAASGRIRLPDVLTPLVHNATDDGWRTLDGLTVTDTRIAGQVTLNFINKPAVSIDRATGHLDVKSGAQPLFGGLCHTYDPAARQF